MNASIETVIKWRCTYPLLIVKKCMRCCCSLNLATLARECFTLCLQHHARKCNFTDQNKNVEECRTVRVVSRLQFDSEWRVAVRARAKKRPEALSNVWQTTNVLVQTPSVECACTALILTHALRNDAVEVVRVANAALNLQVGVRESNRKMAAE